MWGCRSELPKGADEAGVGDVGVFGDEREAVDFGGGGDDAIKLIGVGQFEFGRGQGDFQGDGKDGQVGKNGVEKLAGCFCEFDFAGVGEQADFLKGDV